MAAQLFCIEKPVYCDLCGEEVDKEAKNFGDRWLCSGSRTCTGFDLDDYAERRAYHAPLERYLDAGKYSPEGNQRTMELIIREYNLMVERQIEEDTKQP